MNKASGEKKSAMAIEVKSFIQAAAVIVALMIAAGALTKVIPSGSFKRIVEGGRTLVMDGTYAPTPRPDYPAWRWFTAPAEVLASPDALIVIVLIVFMLFVGAAFRVLEKGGILSALLAMIADKFRSRRYLLMAAVMLFFTIAPSLLGIYEELVPAVVFIVPLALAMGWDSMTGLGMSLLALAFGFAASVFNPFTVGVAQSIASLPLFSGAWFRLLFLASTYGLTFLFVFSHAKKVERDPRKSPTFLHDEGMRAELASPQSTDAAAEKGPMRKAVAWMASWFAASIVFIIVVTRFKSLSDIAFPVVALFFLIAGIGAGLLARMGVRAVVKAALQGALNMLGPVVLVLMAMSVKVIIQAGGILDTILFHAAETIRGTNPFVAAFLMYIVTLALEFFIASASAKAFLVMPILVPLADLVGVTRQTAVFAYDLGDGFSNMLYPTNALLLIAIGLVGVSYGKWIKWTLPLQGIIFLVSMGFLALAVGIKFGPF
jgi:uncharacterized ion transporter superfamily protein YfcC